MKKWIVGGTAGLLILTVSAAYAGSMSYSVLNVLDKKVTQAIVVTTEKPESFKAKLTLYERSGKSLKWQPVIENIPAVIGKNGLAAFGQKQEGDGKTPQGLFPLGPAFGDAPEVKTGLEYRQATDKDLWVDDPASPQYNTWVSGEPQAKSFEQLKRKDDLYKYAMIIQYNTEAPVAGAGSAIFLHVWRGPKQPTSGCVAVAEKSIVQLLERLDRNRQPVILLSLSNE